MLVIGPIASEVKNVGSLSYTQQLRDFAAHASANGLGFDLWVRPTTQLSGPLAQEVANGAIICGTSHDEEEGHR